MAKIQIAELQRVRQWADDRIETGEEPPWSWFQLMKLRENLDAIIGSMLSTTTLKLATEDGEAIVSDDPIEVNLPM
jgi:hypothetical protein